MSQDLSESHYVGALGVLILYRNKAINRPQMECPNPQAAGAEKASHGAFSLLCPSLITLIMSLNF